MEAEGVGAGQRGGPRGAQNRIFRRLNRKERRERRDSGQKELWLALAAAPLLRPGKLAHLDLIGTKVDEQTVFETGGLQATQNLSHMLMGQSFGSFQVFLCVLCVLCG